VTRSALSSGTPEVERSGEKDRAVWIFCKGQCNFIIIQRVHTLSHTQRIMYAEMCLDLCTRPPNMHLLQCRRLGPANTSLLPECSSGPLHVHTLLSPLGM